MSATARRIRENTDPVPPPEDDVHRMICRQLKFVWSSLIRRVDLHMQPLELTGMQWEPVLMLWLKRADTVAGLARVSNMGVASMTRMLDRLERRGLVRRVPNPDDRRAFQLELTEEGKSVVPKLRTAGMKVLNRMLDGFSAKEAQQFEAFLLRILDNA